MVLGLDCTGIPVRGDLRLLGPFQHRVALFCKTAGLSGIDCLNSPLGSRPRLTSPGSGQFTQSALTASYPKSEGPRGHSGL